MSSQITHEPSQRSLSRQHALSDAYHRDWGEGNQYRSGSELISSFRLTQFLGGSSALLREDSDVSDDTMVGVRLKLSPGDALYKQGSSSPYVYVLESGLVQRHNQLDGSGLSDTVTYAGPREWIGLHDQLGWRQESIDAATHASLLAFPAKDIRALSASSPIITELLARRTSMALKRAWRIGYSLRDLPPCTRTVVGLAYLVRLFDSKIEADQHDSTMSVVLGVAMLGPWLGLSLSDLCQCLGLLQRFGALGYEGTHIIELSPQVLFNASHAMSSMSKGQYEDKPGVADWNSSVSECTWQEAS